MLTKCPYHDILLYYMTITGRNKILLTLLIITALAALFTAASVIIILVQKLIPTHMSFSRFFLFPDNIPLLRYNTFPTLLAIAAIAVIVPFFLFRIFYLFEKTQAVEITFFLWALVGVEFEIIRICVPLFQLWEGYSLFLLFINKAVFFSRLFTVLCLFFASIFSGSGIFQQADKNIYILMAAAMVITYSIPINTLNQYTTFIFGYGFESQFLLAKCILVCLTVFSFFLTGRAQSIPVYTSVAVSIALFFLGYGLLCVCDNFIALALGVAAITYGSYRFLQQLHTYYLWQ